MGAKLDLFVSYSHRDSAIARELADKLHETGLRCFLAEKDIGPGQKWEDNIRDALHAADKLILLITPRSKTSLWVAAEAGAAWALGKDLIAALMFVEPSELIEPIRRHQGRVVETSDQVDALVAELSPKPLYTPSDSGLIQGKWVDPTDGDTAFYRQKGNRILGFYDYGSGKKKVGVYMGTLANGILEYE